MRSNASLLKQLLTPVPETCRPPLERLERAALTMNHLTETLLWLNRQDGVMPASESISLNQLLLEELVEEHRYLLAGKDVDIHWDLMDVYYPIPRTLIRLVLANVIRNAMQHTD